jgi:hypothetical protein
MARNGDKSRPNFLNFSFPVHSKEEANNVTQGGEDKNLTSTGLFNNKHACCWTHITAGHNTYI